MNKYKSIEEMFPDWKEARQVIEAQIPTQLKFIFDPDDQNTVIIDFQFIEYLWNVCWETDTWDSVAGCKSKCRTIELIGANIHNSLSEIRREIIPEVEQMLYSPMNKLLLDRLTDMIYRNDMKRKATRKATTIDIIKHCFGVQPCYLSFTE